jgi:hypothetical protein
MNQPEDKDPIDMLLREQDTYLDDNGFTQRVMAALPRRRRSWLRPAFLLGSAAIGWVLAVLWLPWANLPRLSLSAVVSLNSHVLMPWAMMLTVAASVVWAMVAAIQWGLTRPAERNR